MIHSLLTSLIWLAIMFTVIGSGLAVGRLLHLSGWDKDSLGQMLLAAGFGFGLLICGMAVLGWLGLLRPAWAWGLFAVLASLALWGFYKQWRHGQVPLSSVRPVSLESQAQRLPNRWLLLLLLLFGLLFFLSDMAPPLEGDTLHSYLDVPAQFIRAGKILPLPYEVHSHLPLNVQMLSTFALLVSGDELAQLLAGFTMAAGCGLVIYSLGRRYMIETSGLLAALIFLTMNTVLALVPSAKVNLGWAFFDLLNICALCRWAFDARQQDRWLLAAGIYSGLAFGTHYSGLYTAAVCSLFILALAWSKRASLRGFTASAIGRLTLYLAPVGLLAGQWLLRNLIETGNPVFPAFAGIFGGVSYDVPNQATGALGLFTVFWDVSVGYTAKTYGNPIGPICLAALPVLWFVRPLNEKIRLGLVFVLVDYVLWYVGVQRPRNFLPSLALLSLIAAYALLKLNSRSLLLSRLFVLLFVFYLAYNGALYARLHLFRLGKLSYIVGLDTRQAFMERNLSVPGDYPSWRMVRYMNQQLPPDALVIAMYIGTGYYIERMFIDSRMADGDFGSAPFAEADDLIRQWQEVGVTHVFVNEWYPFRDSRAWPPDYALIRSPAFVSACLQEVFSDGDQHLYQFTCLPAVDKLRKSLVQAPAIQINNTGWLYGK